MLDQSDIGISTGAYMGVPLAAALLRIAELAPTAEVCSWGPHSLLHRESARAVASVGLPISVHAPLTHDVLGHRLNGRRNEAIDLHQRHMYVAAGLGASLYIVHPDVQRRRRPWNPTVAMALQRSFEALRVLQDEMKLEVAIENMPFNGRSHYTAPGDLDLQGLSLALDVGHAMITGTLAKWLADPAARMRHVHLHSNLGHAGGDLHLPLGTGVVDAGPAVAAARAAGATIVIEHTCEADVLASIEHLRTRGLLLPQLVR